MATPVAFRLAGWRAHQVHEALSGRVFAITRPIPDLDAVRASVAFFNTDDELTRFVEAVAELARHTPDTLPRRPSLVVIRAPARETDGSEGERA